MSRFPMTGFGGQIEALKAMCRRNVFLGAQTGTVCL